MKKLVEFYLQSGTLRTLWFRDPRSEKEALASSLEKWRLIVEYHSENPEDLHLYGVGGESCGLCEYSNHLSYGDNEEWQECYGCLIVKHTHDAQCRNTSWSKYVSDVEPVVDSATEMYSLLLKIWKEEYGEENWAKYWKKLNKEEQDD